MASCSAVSQLRFWQSRTVSNAGFVSAMIVLVLTSTPRATFGEPPPAGVAVKAETKFVGRVITVAAPISDQVENRVRRIVSQVIDEAKHDERHRWPVIVFDFQAGASDLGKAFDFADYLTSEALSGATTVAYVGETLTGNVVLPVIACDEIVMHPDAEFGDAGHDMKSIGNSERGLYRDIADRRKTIPKAVALGLLDPDLEVLTVETEVSREFVLAQDLDKLRESKAIQSKTVLFRAGEVHMLSATEARKLGFVKLLAKDVAEVAKAWGLPREALQQDPSFGGSWRAIRVPLEGPIAASRIEQVRRMIDESIRKRDVNFICLWIDSPGGSPTDSLTLANYLAALDPSQTRTVAYIAGEARADAAFVALACDQVVMRSDALLSGPGAFQMDDPEKIQLTAEALREIARRKFRSPTLAAALVDPHLEVYRYRRQDDGTVEYFTPSEMEQLKDRDRWERGDRVKEKGEVFRLGSDKAVDFGLATHAVKDFQAFKRLYGLESDPRLVEPGWAHSLIDALRSPSLAWLLLAIGGAAIYAELQAPGIGIGAFIGAVCFVLFFWAMHLGGTAGWLEVLLFVSGIVCVMLELFVLPGFGIFGLGGGLLIFSSLLLASQTFVVPRNEYQVGQFQHSMLIVTGAGMGVIFFIAMLRRTLPHAPLLNQIFQAPPTEEEINEISEREALAHFDELVGQRGRTVTQLTPSGKARFGGVIVDVMCDGDVIAPGAEIEVVQAHAHQIIVREVE